MKALKMRLSVLLITVLLLVACQPATPSTMPGQADGLQVLAAEAFLADIAQNVAGDRLQVQTLLPPDVDPHAFEPTPQDVARLARSQVIIVNGAGLEEAWLSRLLGQAQGEHVLIEAARGLTFRQPSAEEEATHVEGGESDEHHHEEGDPHFWLDPLSVIRYVENIRDGLSQADPAGQAVYARNAAAYIAQLQELHTWIEQQVAQIPPERRLLVTNHESFGYFADRYGFRVVGAVIPSVSSGASPSAQQMALLIENIRRSGAPAIFVELSANPALARQIAQDAGVKLVDNLFTHSLTGADGPAPTYLAMMRHNVTLIVEALK